MEVSVLVLVLVLVVAFEDMLLLPPPVGKEVALTLEYVPVAELPTHHPSGSVFAPAEPQDAGTTPLRRAYAVKNAAYDHVRSRALRSLPSTLENCSGREPLLEEAYFWARLM